MFLRGRSRFIAICTGLVLVSPLAGGPAHARDRPSDTERSFSFRIKPGRLTDALRQISRQAGVQVVTSIAPDLRAAHGLDVRVTVSEALTRITAGLPVRVTHVAGGFVVSPAPAAPTVPYPVPAAPPLETQGEPIVVTGYRESLRQAVTTKRAAAAIVEVTRAEDIAAFPDHNVADALQRLPGIAISRDNGEGRQVSLRGLGPLFTRTTLNGMETLATTASGFDNRGSAARQRRFDYSVFDAGMFSQVEVRKTWSADQDAGGVGGTVALSTMRPFDQPKNVTLLSIQGRAGGNSPGVTPQVTAELSRRSDEWGALAALSYSRNRITEYGYRNWDWAPVIFGGANIGSGVRDADRARLTGAGDPVYMARAQTYSTWTNRFERLNVVGSIQHRTDSGFTLTLDLVHARLANHRDEYSLAAAGTNGLTGNVVGTQILQEATIADNTLVAADLSGVDLRTEHKRTEDRTDFSQAVLSLEYPLDDAATITALAGYACSDFEEPVFDKVFLESTGREFGFVATGSSPRNTYGFAIADPANWSLMRADTREDSIVNENLTARIALSRRLVPGLELRAGGSYRFFGNDGYERRVRIDYEDDPGAPAAAVFLFDGPSDAAYIVGNVDRTFAATGQNRALGEAEGIPGTDYRISERTWTAFALVDLDGAVGQLPVRAQAGLQYQHANIRSAGRISDDVSQSRIARSSSTHAWLPSFEARLELDRDLLLRFAAGRNMNQPDVADLRTAAEVNATPFGGTIITGNPSLEPFTADALDLSLEHYFGRNGYASLGLFYKHLNSFITSETRVIAYADTGYPLEFLSPGQGGSVLYNVVSPVNGSGASIFGVEAALQRDLRFLPAPLDRLGLQANLTLASGSSGITYDGETIDLPLIDLSRWSGNVTLYYSGRRWDARLAAAYRGSYRSGVGNNGNTGQWIKSSLTLDFAVHMAIGEQLQAVVEGRNLTDAPVVQYTDRDARRLLAATHSGRVFSAGLRFRF